MFDVTASIVLFNNDPATLQESIRSFVNTSLNVRLFLIDNSETEALRSCCVRERSEYIFNGNNIGFGAAHNIAIRLVSRKTRYHLVLNPDVSFKAGTLEKLIEFMSLNLQAGVVMPKVLDFKSNVQRLCKRLPSPIDLIIRRLGGTLSQRLFKSKLCFYEMCEQDYNSSFQAPSLSGCFLFFRIEALEKAGQFDERFFLYMEDIDICRRIHRHFKTCYFPEVEIFHAHARESYKLNKLFLVHTISAIRYFNKWGWFIDRERDKFNYENTSLSN